MCASGMGEKCIERAERMCSCTLQSAARWRTCELFCIETWQCRYRGYLHRRPRIAAPSKINSFPFSFFLVGNLHIWACEPARPTLSTSKNRRRTMNYVKFTGKMIAAASATFAPLKYYHSIFRLFNFQRACARIHFFLAARFSFKIGMINRIHWRWFSGTQSLIDELMTNFGANARAHTRSHLPFRSPGTERTFFNFKLSQARLPLPGSRSGREQSERSETEQPSQIRIDCVT